MVGIYKITNLINGKSYIGQSVNIERRFIHHKSVAFNQKDKNYNYPLYKSIRKYGIENFSFDILEECDVSELSNKEVYYISKYNSHGKFGYNQDDGGNHASHYTKLSEELVDAIIQKLKTSLDNSDEIGKEFGVSGRTVRSINSGEYYLRDNESYPIRSPLYVLNKDAALKIHEYYCIDCGKKITVNNGRCVECYRKTQQRANKPEPLELAKLVKENGFMGTGRLFGVDGNSIKKWCKNYGMPKLKNELIDWYNKQMGIVDVSTVKEGNVKTVQGKRVKQIDPNTGLILNIFTSENDAARHLGRKGGNHIGEACKGILDIVYGFRWGYV